MNSIDTAIIDPNKTLRELFGNAEDREKHKINPVYQEFQRQIRRLLAVADMHMLEYGEVLMWINRKFGLVWDTIPYFKFPEIEFELHRCWFRMFQIFNPEQHEQLMLTENEYSSWFNYQVTHASPKEAPIGND